MDSMMAEGIVGAVAYGLGLGQAVGPGSIALLAVALFILAALRRQAWLSMPSVRVPSVLLLRARGRVLAQRRAGTAKLS